MVLAAVLYVLLLFLGVGGADVPAAAARALHDLALTLKDELAALADINQFDFPLPRCAVCGVLGAAAMILSNFFIITLGRILSSGAGKNFVSHLLFRIAFFTV